MSTAIEVKAKLTETTKSLDSVLGRINTCVDMTFYAALGREVCARRARKLRRRGEYVVKWEPTSTGKARYRWLPQWFIQYS